MIRGTTPTLEFKLPMSVNTIAAAYVSFAQRGEVKIDKPLDECSCGPDTLTVQLTQEETLLLTAGLPTEIQIRVVDNAGRAMASQIMKTNTDRILKDGVI